MNLVLLAPLTVLASSLHIRHGKNLQPFFETLEEEHISMEMVRFLLITGILTALLTPLIQLGLLRALARNNRYIKVRLHKSRLMMVKSATTDTMAGATEMLDLYL